MLPRIAEGEKKKEGRETNDVQEGEDLGKGRI